MMEYVEESEIAGNENSVCGSRQWVEGHPELPLLGSVEIIKL